MKWVLLYTTFQGYLCHISCKTKSGLEKNVRGGGQPLMTSTSTKRLTFVHECQLILMIKKNEYEYLVTS